MIKNATFHHVGIATGSICDTSTVYLAAEYEATDTVFDPIQNVKIAFLKKQGNPLLELIEPIDKTSPVHNILKKVGVSAYHFCYEVDNIAQAITELEQQDFRILVEPVNAVAFDNRLICFLYHINVGLIELLER
jgi:methylmalonyl-CoA/ethylmalonyl-CoA epimerase